MEYTHTEKEKENVIELFVAGISDKYDQTHFLLQIMGLFASYDPVRMILMISET